MQFWQAITVPIPKNDDSISLPFVLFVLFTSLGLVVLGIVRSDRIRSHERVGSKTGSDMYCTVHGVMFLLSHLCTENLLQKTLFVHYY